MAVIEFRTLGTLDLRRTGGSELHSLLAQPKRVALLAYLCVANPRGFHRRDTLLGLFWPESDESHARISLRNALHVLRHSLGESTLVSRGDDEVGISPDLVWCDAVAFEQNAGSDGVEDAVDLYRGDFLAGFFLDDAPAFERWAEAERARLRSIAARSARVAAERREKEQNLTDAINLARRAVDLTDSDERAVRRLIELLARAGDRAGALQAYDKFARHLADQFEAEPSPDTRAVVDRVRGEQIASWEVRASQPKPPLTVDADQLKAPGYSIERELGRGGMATVFVGRDLKHDRRVAIKILRPDVAAVLGVDRFLTEIAIASKLNHPHILPLLDSGKASGLPFYVMPYTDGETLRSHLRRERILSVDEAIGIACEVADALSHAHAHGIVHRDIKPENILLENGHALVADFGIARALTQASSQRLTQPGLAIGTAAYMSPERADEGEQVDARTDVYALGCVVYEMVTGDPPFPGSNTQAILARKATEPARPLRGVRETISPGIERAILKALSRVPADRFATVKDFADALRRQPAVTTSLIARTTRVRSLVGATVVVLIALAVVLTRVSLHGATDSRVVLSDRRLLTNTGRVSYPNISPDGKTLAYLLSECRTKGCTYGIEAQDIDGSASRQLIDSISELTQGGLEWSPDRRNILAFGRMKGQQGTFLISTLAGTAHLLGKSLFTFWADGDSLLTPHPGGPDRFWVLVSGLDGVARDSFPVRGEGEPPTRLIPIPNSRWIIAGTGKGAPVQWVSFDRSGRIVGRMSPRPGSPPVPRGSADAFWIGAHKPGSNLLSVIRIPFDARTGLFGRHEDTVYTGNPTSVGVSADGGTFVVDEGTTEFNLWALDFRDAIRGVFPEKGRLMTATSVLANELSPDGKKVLIGRVSGSGSREETRWDVFPFGGGHSTLISGTPASGFWADSSTLTLETETPAGIELSLLDVNTGVQRGSSVLPDSDIEAFVSLPGGGWAWAANGIGSIRVLRSGEAVRTFKVPDWYMHIGTLSVSRDGKTLAFVGRGPPQRRDSVRMSLMSLSDGVVTPVKTVFGGFPFPTLLTDGSMLFGVWDTPDRLTLYHLRRSGENDWTASFPRPVWAFSVSHDMRRVGITVRDYHADALLSRVIRH